MRKQTRLLTIASTLALAALSHADIFAVTFGGTLINIDSNTGNATTIGNLGVGSMNSLVIHVGSLYSTSLSGKIYRINRSTGVATFEANVQAGSNDIRGISSDGAGNVWAVTNESPTDKLWKINLSTGIGTLVGDTGLTTIQSLDNDSKGQLWAYDNNTMGLCRLNRLTGAAIDVDATIGNQNSMQSITFTNAGTLFGGQNKLFSIDPATGASTAVGGTYDDVRGMDTDNSFLFTSLANSATVRLGKAAHGDKVSLAEDDQDTLQVCNFIVPNQVTPPVQVEMTGTAPSTQLSSYAFTLKHRMASAGPFKCTYQMFNYNIGRFVAMADLPVGPNFVTQTVSPTGNLDDFVSSTKEVKVKYLVRPVGPIPANFWCHDAEQAYWTIEPFIQ